MIHDVGQGGLFDGGSEVEDVGGDGVVQGTIYGAEYDAHYVGNFAANRKGYFHYVLMAHRLLHYQGNDFTGMAESSSIELRDEMMTSLRCIGNPEHVGRLIAHELGHNLMLKHGGQENCNSKPNYNSLMNYRYTWTGIDTDCDAWGDGVNDFSDGLRPPLDENDLSEHAGVCGHTPIDWNLDSILSANLKHDLNNHSCNGDYSILKDHDDWASARIDMRIDGDETGPVKEEAIVCPAPPEEIEFIE